MLFLKKEDRLLFPHRSQPEFSDRVGHFPAVRGVVAAVLSWLGPVPAALSPGVAPLSAVHAGAMPTPKASSLKD